MDGLPFSQSCENNKEPILAVLQRVFADRVNVLEVAAGTGQHACHFAGHLPWLTWQPTEIEENLPILRPRCELYPGGNLAAPAALDVRKHPWPVGIPDALFSANSLHIMAWSAVEAMFQSLAQGAGSDVKLAIYGPFNYGGRYTSESNARFDTWLADRNSESAIRDFEKVDILARDAGFLLQEDFDMPANNRLLVWQKRAA